MENTKSVHEMVCPYWLAGSLDTPLRRIVQNPDKILNGLVQPGQTALDLGCGPGYFTLGLARLVGPQGRVIAVDLQPEMLAKARAKAIKAGLAERIRFHQSEKERIGLDEPVDFVLAFWMVHEVRHPDLFLHEVSCLLKPSGTMLIVEPKVHVIKDNFDKTLELARSEGLVQVAERKVWISRGAVLRKTL